MNNADLAPFYVLRIFQGLSLIIFFLYTGIWLELSIKSRRHDIRVFGTTNPWSFAWKYYWSDVKNRAIFCLIFFVWAVILELAYF